MLLFHGSRGEGDETSLPVSIGNSDTSGYGSAKLVAQSDPHILDEFRGPQLDAQSALVQADEPHQARWNDQIDPVIIPAAGEVGTAALRRLARFCGFGASKRMGQFAVGFPIAGDIPQKNTLPI